MRTTPSPFPNPNRIAHVKASELDVGDFIRVPHASYRDPFDTARIDSWSHDHATDKVEIHFEYLDVIGWQTDKFATRIFHGDDLVSLVIPSQDHRYRESKQ